MTISLKDIVKHNLLDIEMLVVDKKSPWMTCEYADENGERVEKVYHESFLELTSKKSGITMTEDSLKGW